MEIDRVSRYIADMSGTIRNTTVPEPALTEAQRTARAASIARARAQAAAGETAPAEAVYDWLASWGTENELPPPERPIQNKIGNSTK